MRRRSMIYTYIQVDAPIENILTMYETAANYH